MYLVIVEGSAPERASAGLISVWVQDADAAVAQRRALDALQAAGFATGTVDSVTVTGPEDYFRPCASKAAFEQALREGVAWRVQD
jgi:hypothetical protein